MAEEEKQGPEPKDAPAQGIDFYTFIFSLASSAFVHLGDAPHPETEKVEANLLLAKQTIDILGMLQEKTKGNLTADEDKVLENILMDLRLRFVTKQKGGE